MLLCLRFFRAAARGRLGSFKVQGFEFFKVKLVEGFMVWGSLEFRDYGLWFFMVFGFGLLWI